MITNILLKITRLSRTTKQLILMLFDSSVLIPILFVSFSLRLGYWYFPTNNLFWVIIFSPIVAIPIFYSFGLYHSVIRYIGFTTLWKIFQAATLYALVWGFLGFMVSNGNDWFTHVLPRSVILMNWLFTLFVIGGFRMVSTWLFTIVNNGGNDKVVIYGAGSAGRELSNALTQSNNYKQIAFIDDDIEKQGQSLNGFTVLSVDKLDNLIKKQNITKVLLALPSVSRSRRKEIIGFLEPFSVTVSSLPALSEIAQGKVKIEDLLEIDIRDLLGRDTVQPNKDLLKINITDKVVLVTGAGGSIGSELCRQIILLKPKQLILFEISESSLYQIEQELNNIARPNIEIFPVIGSVRDFIRMKNIFNYYEVQTIYHAAAYKHVPLVEFNQSQGVLNNSLGTMLAAEAAIAAKVEIFVLVSTDKAVRPTSIMGATKRVAELVLQALSVQPHNTCFTMVRFGNVLDSSGSVIPLFKKQIKQGGPITVTDVNMVRYFMTISEAVELVIQAGAMSRGGDVFVLDMGEPMKIYDLALKMIQLSGLQVLNENHPDGDIEIKFTGLRPGEKLYEELLVGENVTETENKLIMRANEEMIDWKKLKPILNELNEASINNNYERIRELLKELVPEFNPQFTM